MLVGNKLDLAEAGQRQVSTEEAQKFADEEGLMFMEVSAKTAQGVKEVFDKIGESPSSLSPPRPVPSPKKRPPLPCRIGSKLTNREFLPVPFSSRTNADRLACRSTITSRRRRRRISRRSGRRRPPARRRRQGPHRRLRLLNGPTQGPRSFGSVRGLLVVSSPLLAYGLFSFAP